METQSLLTRNDVAATARLSMRTIDEHVARGQLRPVRFGRAVRFTHAEVWRWIAAHLERDESEVTHGA